MACRKGTRRSPGRAAAPHPATRGTPGRPDPPRPSTLPSQRRRSSPLWTRRAQTAEGNINPLQLPPVCKEACGPGRHPSHPRQWKPWRGEGAIGRQTGRRLTVGVQAAPVPSEVDMSAVARHRDAPQGRRRGLEEQGGAVGRQGRAARARRRRAGGRQEGGGGAATREAWGNPQ